MPRTLRAVLPAVLFTGSGLLTYEVYYWVTTRPDEYQFALQLLTGLPFGISCGLRFMRPRKWIPAAVVLDGLTWLLAYRIGLALAGSVNPFVGMGVAGMIGGLGVTAATGLGCSGLYSRATLAGAAIVGAIAGTLFGLAFYQNAREHMILAFAFPIWQVAVGLWIWYRPKA